MKDHYGNELTGNILKLAEERGLTGQLVFHKDDYHGVLSTKFIDGNKGNGMVVQENNDDGAKNIAVYFMGDGVMVYGEVPDNKLECVGREITDNGTLADTFDALDIKFSTTYMSQAPDLNLGDKQ